MCGRWNVLRLAFFSERASFWKQPAEGEGTGGGERWRLLVPTLFLADALPPALSIYPCISNPGTIHLSLLVLLVLVLPILSLSPVPAVFQLKAPLR